MALAYDDKDHDEVHDEVYDEVYDEVHDEVQQEDVGTNCHEIFLEDEVYDHMMVDDMACDAFESPAPRCWF